MSIKHQHQLEGQHNKPILVDLRVPKTANGELIIFCHGYKGFKDWGCWDLAADQFTAADFGFLKFNFSHNGCTPEQPYDCPDPEAFAMNNFSKEMDDLHTVIDWVNSERFRTSHGIHPEKIHLIGHSRGGGIVTLKAAEDDRVDTVTSWAGVSDFKARFADEETLAYWKKNRVIYIENSRTKQQLPHYYQFYEDFIENEERFTIKNAAQSLEIPHLIVHGTQDPTVGLQEAHALKSWNPDAKLHIIEGADHVFGGGHPWEEKALPEAMKEAVDATLKFLND